MRFSTWITPRVKASDVGMRDIWAALGVAVLALAGVGLVSGYALLTVLLDGLSALLVVGPPILAGLWLVPLLRLGPLPWRWHWLLGACLGLGSTSLLVLLLGLAGIMERKVYVILLIAMTVVGVMRVGILGEDTKRRSQTVAMEVDAPAAGGWRWMWVLVVPFLAAGLLAASHPPGLLWSEEGDGYDVLEYHLQLPKEYLQNGRISYLPHNVYASFPANVEMLYMLAMIVHGTVADSGSVAHMIHFLFGVLTVGAVWVAGSEWSPRAGIVSAVVAGSCGWIPYLSGLAYVENGLLFFEAAALAVMLRAFGRVETGEQIHEVTNQVRDRSRVGWWLLMGIAIGLACGCKYTALAMVFAPLVLVSAVHGYWPRWGGGRAVAGVAAGTAIALGPWLAKNQAMTGNPIFPLANRVVGAQPTGWGPQETERWERGHSLTRGQDGIAGSLREAWAHSVGDRNQQLGPLVLLLSPLGLLRRGREWTDYGLILVVSMQMAVWFLFTHLFARFTVAALVPLALLAGRSVTSEPSPRRRRVVVAGMILGAVWNGTFVAGLWAEEMALGIPVAAIYEGRVPGYDVYGIVNSDLPADAKVLLVGEARAFYFHPPVDYCVAFNRNPFLEQAMGGASAAELIEWLSLRGYTHVLVNWSEVGRIARTYGFSPPTDRIALTKAFAELEAAGLTCVGSLRHPGRELPWAGLYLVPQKKR